MVPGEAVDKLHLRENLISKKEKRKKKKENGKKMVPCPCSSGDRVMPATHISSSRCQWCAPRERAKEQSELWPSCDSSPSKIKKRKKKKDVPSKCSEKCFLNKVRNCEQKTHPGFTPAVHLIPGNSDYTLPEKDKKIKHAWIHVHTHQFEPHKHLQLSVGSSFLGFFLKKCSQNVDFVPIVLIFTMWTLRSESEA